MSTVEKLDTKQAKKEPASKLPMVEFVVSSRSGSSTLPQLGEMTLKAVDESEAVRQYILANDVKLKDVCSYQFRAARKE